MIHKSKLKPVKLYKNLQRGDMVFWFLSPNDEFPNLGFIISYFKKEEVGMFIFWDAMKMYFGNLEVYYDTDLNNNLYKQK